MLIISPSARSGANSDITSLTGLSQVYFPVTAVSVNSGPSADTTQITATGHNFIAGDKIILSGLNTSNYFLNAYAPYLTVSATSLVAGVSFKLVEAVASVAQSSLTNTTVALVNSPQLQIITNTDTYGSVMGNLYLKSNPAIHDLGTTIILEATDNAGPPPAIYRNWIYGSQNPGIQVGPGLRVLTGSTSASGSLIADFLAGGCVLYDDPGTARLTTNSTGVTVVGTVTAAAGAAANGLTVTTTTAAGSGTSSTIVATPTGNSLHTTINLRGTNSGGGLTENYITGRGSDGGIDIGGSGGVTVFTVNAGNGGPTTGSPMLRVKNTSTDATIFNAVQNGQTTVAIDAKASQTGSLQAWRNSSSVVQSEVDVNGNFVTSAIGCTVKIKSGSNAKAGTFTLVAGTATVSNTAVTANSVIIVTLKTAGGVRTGNPDVVPTASTGFVATQIGGVGDTSTYNYVIVEVN